MPQITTTAESTKRELRRFAREFAIPNGEMNKLVVGRATQDVRKWVVDRIKAAGRGSWRALSRWTKLRTGRTKPLSTIDLRRIRARRKGARGTVDFLSPSTEWNLTSHHFGFSVRATNKPMAFRLADGTLARFRRRRSFVVPARKIWPSERTVTQITNRRIRMLEKKLSRDFSPGI